MKIPQSATLFRIAVGFVWLLAMCGPVSAQARLKPSDLKGTYTITGGENGGQAEPPERVEGTVVTFTEETIVVTAPDKKEIYSATYTLAPSDKPGMTHIRMTSRVPADKKERAGGLIAKDKDGLVKLIYALPGGDEPTEFRTRTNQLMFVMKPVEGTTGP
jgi:uncharacterized protein (TIGR03067 family)